MKHKLSIAVLLVLLIGMTFPGIALAKELRDDKVVAGGSFTLESGETLDGNLLIFGGAVTLEEGSLVNGDVVLMGGSLSIDGEVDGSVVGIGGIVNLGSTAEIDGDITVIGAGLNRDEGARVSGEVISGFDGPFSFEIPGRIEIPSIPDIPTVPNIEIRGFNVFWSGLWFLFRTFLWAALAMLVVMFLPNPTERVARTAIGQPALSGAVGLLTTVVVPLLLVVIALTLILIPISLIGGLVLVVAWFFGRIAIGLEIGKRLGETMNQVWSLPVAAGVGTFVLTLVIDGAGELIACVGWILPTVVGLIGLGSVLLTRFGNQNYPPDYAVLAPGIPPTVQPSVPPLASPTPVVAPAEPEAEQPVLPPEQGMSEEGFESG